LAPGGAAPAPHCWASPGLLSMPIDHANNYDTKASPQKTFGAHPFVLVSNLIAVIPAGIVS